jgi:CrcB protein
MSAVAPGVAPMMATLGVNLVGSMILGGVVAGLGANPRQHGWVLLLGVGLCGGLTTFSTLAMELADLMHAKRYWGAVLYGVGSLVVGVVMFMLGVWIVRRWVGEVEVV